MNLKQLQQETEEMFDEKSIGSNNIELLIKEMEKEAEEYGQYHDNDCLAASENASFGDKCECEIISELKKFAKEQMIKVNDKWFKLTEAHRPYCTPEGNKVITRILGKKNRNIAASRESIAYEAGRQSVIDEWNHEHRKFISGVLSQKAKEVMKKISALRIPTYYGEPYGAGDKIVNDAIDKALEIVKEVMI